MINLTPHPIIVRTPEGDVTLSPSGAVARVATTEAAVDPVAIGGHSIPVVQRTMGEIVGLPETDEPCIVSSLVLEAVRIQQPWRRRVYAPDTGPTAIRDAAGRVVAVTRLVSV